MLQVITNSSVLLNVLPEGQLLKLHCNLMSTIISSLCDDDRILATVPMLITVTGLGRTSAGGAPPFFIDSPPAGCKEAPASLPVATHALSLCLHSHAAITAAGSYPLPNHVRASNLPSIKAMQREFMLACHGNERRSGESFEQVDR